MGATVTISWLMVFGIFLLGLALGWTIAKVRSGSLSVELSGPTSSEPGMTSSVKFQKTMVRSLALKCKCGETWKFAEGTGPLPPGSQPMPTGDSFVCPNCGNSINLKLERQVEAEALANLKLPNKL
jgi:hypothetical protein